MSGDVQPRKRKDKKRKKDDLGSVDEPPRYEPRGTAAVLGEGDVFMHHYHDHGTGGHWCAKIVFFSLLAILLTLVGLIILENRGLSELEANSVESRYSGVLEGWLEDAPDDDHHDEHTLELKHHDDEDDNHGSEDEGYGDDDDDEEGHEDDENEEDDHDSGNDDLEDEGNEDGHDENQDAADNSQEYNEEDEDQEIEKGDEDDNEEEGYFSKFFGISNTEKTANLNDDHLDDDDDDDENQDNDDEQEQDNRDDENEFDTHGELNEDEGRNIEADDFDDDNGNDFLDGNDDEEGIDENTYDDQAVEQNNDEYETETRYEDEPNFFDDYETEASSKNANKDDDEHDDDEEHEEEDEEIEVERIEKEALENEEPISTELPALPEADDDNDDDGDKKAVQDDADSPDDDDGDDGTDGYDDDDFLDADPPPVVERITAPAGKPLPEIDDDEDSSERPPDMLEEEEEYEKKQEERRREEEQASSKMWLKLAVGLALLAATFSLVSRASAPRDSPEREDIGREETPVTDRRMTLIAEEAEPPKPVVPKKLVEAKTPIQEVVKQIPTVGKYPRVVEQDSDEEEPEEVEPEFSDKNEELYSDEDVEDEEEIVVKKQTPKEQTAPQKVPEISDPDDEVPDDVEIIEDEQLGDELEEEDEEEEISDVDDVELLNRLEQKYGRLPEPERPGQKHNKDGGNSLEDWHGEPSDPFWRQQLDSAERELRQGEWKSAAEKAGAPELSSSARARWIVASALDRAAEAKKDNHLLTRAIAAYLELLKMNERLSDKRLVKIAARVLDRIQFRGAYLKAEPVYRLLIRRFPDDISYRHNLTVVYLMSTRPDLAEVLVKDTLLRWPNDRVALAHYAFALKIQHNKLEEAAEMFGRALEGDTGPACETRFYYHYGDTLLLLGRFKEAHEVHKRGAKHGHFLSPVQRSQYNVPRLKAQPWWNVEDTPYATLAKTLENNWRQILKEGQAAATLYEQEKEGLLKRGQWSQLDLYVNGRQIPERCAKAPVTCAVVKTEAAAVGCRRGQIKFSSMAAGTYVRPHTGPTNCRLRMHLGLTNTKDTYIRVDKEIRQWQEGKVLMFDDSFEHEVWHNGTGTRLVLIVDVWHPELTAAERRQLPSI